VGATGIEPVTPFRVKREMTQILVCSDAYTIAKTGSSHFKALECYSVATRLRSALEARGVRDLAAPLPPSYNRILRGLLHLRSDLEPDFGTLM